MSEEKKEEAVYDGTDIDNAIIFVNCFKNDLKAVYNGKKADWYYYDKTCWQPLTKGAINEFAKKVINKLKEKAESSDRNKLAIENVIKYLKKSGKRKKMITDAASDPELSMEYKDFDKHLYLLNLKNATVDLSSGTVKPRPPDPRDYITQIAPVTYDPDATCPMWAQFLDKMFDGDTEIISFIQRAVGYSLTGSTQEQALFFLFGKGQNGKSTFIKTLQEMLGNYAQKAPACLLTQNGRYAMIPTDIARMKGVRLAIASETDETKPWDEGKIKDLTGCDTLSARKMRQDFVDFEASHKLWVLGNNKPIIQGTDDGIWRRMIVIPVTGIFSEDERIRMETAMEMFRSESSGILNWALAGYVEYVTKGLAIPEIIRNETLEFRNSMDVLGAFIEETCTVSAEASCTVKKLFELYLSWTKEVKEQALSKIKLGRALRNRGFKLSSGTNNIQEWQGITPNSEKIALKVVNA